MIWTSCDLWRIVVFTRRCLAAAELQPVAVPDRPEDRATTAPFLCETTSSGLCLFNCANSTLSSMLGTLGMSRSLQGQDLGILQAKHLGWMGRVQNHLLSQENGFWGRLCPNPTGWICLFWDFCSKSCVLSPPAPGGSPRAGSSCSSPALDRVPAGHWKIPSS